MKKINLLIIIILLIFSSCSSSNRAIKNTTPKEVKKEIAKVEPSTKEIEAKAIELEKAIQLEKAKAIELEKIKAIELEKAKIIELEKTKAIELEKAKAIELKKIKAAKTVALFDHTTLNDLIQQNVAKNGEVNYKGFKNNWSVLRGYIKALGNQLPEDSWSREEKLSYWMNAYNALTVDLILRNYPLASIKDIKDPWDQRLWKLGAKWYNLNEIEHNILRKMNDPRIHFGINCASFSCPPLLNEAFTPSKVDSQLNFLAKRFINDTERNIITENNIKISKIFSWFSKDFKQDGNLISFLNKYAETPISEKAKRSYVDYNWDLNEQ